MHLADRARRVEPAVVVVVRGVERSRDDHREDGDQRDHHPKSRALTKHGEEHAPAGCSCQAGGDGRAVRRRERPSRMRGRSRER